MIAHASLTREFSAIEPLQRPYLLTYEMEDDAGGCCRLTVSRTGEAACLDSLILDAPPLFCYALLRYLYENCVQPEIWRDVVAECYAAAARPDGKGVVTGE